jgi:chromosome segregation ATPase
MVAPVDQPEEAASDIEKTDELPVLDVASYEAGLRREEASADPAAAEASVDWAEFRPPPVPPTDVLRDVEAWIAAQTARARSSELALAELQQAHTDAQSQANNLALELEAARKSLQTALSRANESERAAQAADTAAQDADSRAARLQAELESAQQETVANGERFAGANAEIAQLRESVAAGVREQETLQQRHEEISRTLDDRTSQVSQLQTELEKLRATITETELELTRRAEHAASLERARDNQQAILGGLER